MEIAYNSFYDSLSYPEQLDYLNTSRSALLNIYSGEKVQITDDGLLHYIKEFFSSDNVVVPDSEYGELFEPDFKLNVRTRISYPFPPDLPIVTTVFGGNIFKVKAISAGPSYNPWSSWSTRMYLNGEYLYSEEHKDVINSRHNLVYVTRQAEKFFLEVAYNSASNVFLTRDLLLQGGNVLEGDKVNVVTNPYSYLYGDYYSPSDLTLDLPLVPGVTTKDDLDNIVFPGSLEDLLDRINEDSNFRTSILDRLLGLDNHDLANQSALDTHVDADGNIVVAPKDDTVPFVPDIPIDTPFEDTPVVDVPEHVGGVWGWLYQLLVSLLNVLKNILGSVGSLIGSLIKALLALFTNLFTLRYDIISEFTTDIQKILKNKLGTNVYLSMFNQIKNLNGIPIPRQYIGDVVVLETDYINNLADTLKSWQRWFYYIMIALYNLNNVYKLIRGGEMISRSNKNK